MQTYAQSLTNPDEAIREHQQHTDAPLNRKARREAAALDRRDKRRALATKGE